MSESPPETRYSATSTVVARQHSRFKADKHLATCNPLFDISLFFEEDIKV